MAARRDIRTLERRLNRVSERLIESITELMRDVIEDIGDTLVPATPYLTGYARGNWRPTLNIPSSTPVAILDPTGEATKARIANVAVFYQLGDTVYIRNNIDYIADLNRGSSPQAPADFVAKSARTGLKIAFRRHSGRRRL